jgi:hypothetical protein
MFFPCCEPVKRIAKLLPNRAERSTRVATSEAASPRIRAEQSDLDAREKFTEPLNEQPRKKHPTNRTEPLLSDRVLQRPVGCSARKAAPDNREPGRGITCDLRLERAKAARIPGRTRRWVSQPQAGACRSKRLACFSGYPNAVFLIWCFGIIRMDWPQDFLGRAALTVHDNQKCRAQRRSGCDSRRALGTGDETQRNWLPRGVPPCVVLQARGHRRDFRFLRIRLLALTF